MKQKTSEECRKKVSANSQFFVVDKIKCSVFSLSHKVTNKVEPVGQVFVCFTVWVGKPIVSKTVIGSEDEVTL